MKKVSVLTSFAPDPTVIYLYYHFFKKYLEKEVDNLYIFYTHGKWAREGAYERGVTWVHDIRDYFYDLFHSLDVNLRWYEVGYGELSDPSTFGDMTLPYYLKGSRYSPDYRLEENTKNTHSSDYMLSQVDEDDIVFYLDSDCFFYNERGLLDLKDVREGRVDLVGTFPSGGAAVELYDEITQHYANCITHSAYFITQKVYMSQLQPIPFVTTFFGEPLIFGQMLLPKGYYIDWLSYVTKEECRMEGGSWAGAQLVAREIVDPEKIIIYEPTPRLYLHPDTLELNLLNEEAGWLHLFAMNSMQAIFPNLLPRREEIADWTFDRVVSQFAWFFVGRKLLISAGSRVVTQSPFIDYMKMYQYYCDKFGIDKMVDEIGKYTKVIEEKIL